MACVSTGAWGAWHPRVLADSLTLFKPGGQIMPTTLLLGNRGSKIVIQDLDMHMQGTHHTANLNKSEWLVTNGTTARSKYIP